MDNFFATQPHEEGRLFHHIVPDIDNQIGTLNRAVDIVLVRQSSSAKEAFVPFADDSHAHLRAEKVDACFVDESFHSLLRPFAISPDSYQ